MMAAMTPASGPFTVPLVQRKTAILDCVLLPGKWSCHSQGPHRCTRMGVFWPNVLGGP